MENDLFVLGLPIAVVCVNTAQFKEFLAPVVHEHRKQFSQVSLPDHFRGRKYSGVIQLAGTDAIPYQRMIRAIRGEQVVQLPKKMFGRKGWKGMPLSRKDRL